MNDPLAAFRKRRSYLSLTSFRKDGSEVATTVWVVADGDRLLMRTDAESHKVRRMRANGDVRVAPSDGRGKAQGEPIPATARELPASEKRHVERLIARKYPIGFWTEIALWRPLNAAMSLVGLGKRRGSPLFWEIVPEAVAIEEDRATEGGSRWVSGLAPVFVLVNALEGFPVELM